MRNRHARGQSLVETALGTMVFVTILLFGIYFAEVGALSLKVQEAANFALWNATGRVMHDPESNDWGRRGTALAAEAEANNRYVDFDGRSSRGGGRGVPLQQAIARAQPIQVDCRAELPGGVPGLSMADAAPGLAGTLVMGTQGMGCTASSSIRGVRIGRYLEEGRSGFFQTSQRRVSDAFTVCAAGRASGGRCTARFGMLLDDWGLSTVAEGRSCALNINGARRCANPDYYEWTQRVYRANGGGGNAGSALAALTGSDGVNEDQFFMSFRGEEDRYEENLGSTHAGGQARWEVTPFDAPNIRSYNANRANRWLGVPR
ncbi:hypothetical protein [Comamonas sp. JC664]|uniref:hypothetical protein n=1 Tax=Comamonas sp. JC664 TaxID=2801917 RepID=UPI00174DDCAF|nr:hypothetical protein [Comamonas sp. JC664]MBL0695441.1 hypothetical protein [Comamonas sp. JC664]GHG88042.1 hypothetical protein GCM10012319_46430 [Comamonas sp. KCTC 72670]